MVNKSANTDCDTAGFAYLRASGWLQRLARQIPRPALGSNVMPPKNATLLVLALLLPMVSTAQDQCTAQADAEQRRIERDFRAQRPAKGDMAAEVKWSNDLHAALAATAKRFEDCTRLSTPKPSPAATAKIDECLAGVRRRGDDLQRRYGGRTLTFQEQTVRRGEEQRLQDEYMSCTRTTPR